MNRYKGWALEPKMFSKRISDLKHTIMRGISGMYLQMQELVEETIYLLEKMSLRYFWSFRGMKKDTSTSGHRVETGLQNFR